MRAWALSTTDWAATSCVCCPPLRSPSPSTSTRCSGSAPPSAPTGSRSRLNTRERVHARVRLRSSHRLPRTRAGLFLLLHQKRRALLLNSFFSFLFFFLLPRTQKLRRAISQLQSWRSIHTRAHRSDLHTSARLSPRARGSCQCGEDRWGVSLLATYRFLRSGLRPIHRLNGTVKPI